MSDGNGLTAWCRTIDTRSLAFGKWSTRCRLLSSTGRTPRWSGQPSRTGPEPGEDGSDPAACTPERPDRAGRRRPRVGAAWGGWRPRRSTCPGRASRRWRSPPEQQGALGGLREGDRGIQDADGAPAQKKSASNGLRARHSFPGWTGRPRAHCIGLNFPVNPPSNPARCCRRRTFAQYYAVARGLAGHTWIVSQGSGPSDRRRPNFCSACCSPSTEQAAPAETGAAFLPSGGRDRKGWQQTPCSARARVMRTLQQLASPEPGRGVGCAKRNRGPAAQLDRSRRSSDRHPRFRQRSAAWNPKMGPHIYGKRNGIHIVDIKETTRRSPAGG